MMGERGVAALDAFGWCSLGCRFYIVSRGTVFSRIPVSILASLSPPSLSSCYVSLTLLFSSCGGDGGGGGGVKWL